MSGSSFHQISQKGQTRRQGGIAKPAVVAVPRRRIWGAKLRFRALRQGLTSRSLATDAPKDTATEWKPTYDDENGIAIELPEGCARGIR